MAEVEQLTAMFPVRWLFDRTSDGILTVHWRQPGSQPATPGSDKGGIVDRLLPPNEGPGIQVAEDVWNAIARDQANKVVVLTGHDGVFYDTAIRTQPELRPAWNAREWETMLYRVPRSILAFLDMPTVLIGAANGPATIHSEYLLMCDIVVAAESAFFEDRPHLPSNAVPGDGVGIFWPLLLGWNRGRSLLLTGGHLSAQDAKEFGLVHEVVPDDELLPRCHEIARDLLRHSELTLRYTAPTLRQQLKVQVVQHLQHTLALEGILKVAPEIAE